MKKILSFLVTITLIIINITSLVSCNITIKYTSEKLIEIKEKNSINIKKNILEWIAPQEKPFNKVDNKYYFVIWHGEENNNWKISEFKNNLYGYVNFDNFNNYKLFKTNLGDLYIQKKSGFVRNAFKWNYNNGNYFKAVYRWNFDTDIPVLYLNNKTGEIKVE